MLLVELARSQIEQYALQAGFSSVGFTTAANATTFSHLCDWIDHGYAGTMSYLERRREAYRHPQGVLKNCRSLVLLTLSYQPHPWTRKSSKRYSLELDLSKERGQKSINMPHRGTIGSYAAAREDYHDWIRERLNPLLSELHRMFPNNHSRVVVDTAPLLEREFAHRAGLGWIGKNTMLLNRNLGSYFFLCGILTDIDLNADSALDTSAGKGTKSAGHCGTCTACLDACPTQAFQGPYVLDASRCISYWTIEHRGSIPESMREGIGPWIFGCDICQIVCPWNRKPKLDSPEGIAPQGLEAKSDCLHWLQLDDAKFHALYRSTPFWRTGLLRLQRNAMIVAANLGCKEAIPLLRSYSQHHEQFVRETAVWALDKLSTTAGKITYQETTEPTAQD